MAVYTSIDPDDLDRFLSGFDIGTVVSCDGIAEGIENSNYLLKTTVSKFVLTLFEKRVAPKDLPFFLGLMTYLSDTGFPCPGPVPDRSGEVLHQLSGRPATLVRFAPGAWPRRVTPDHCREAGSALARLHLIAADYTGMRKNDLSLGAWRNLVDGLGNRPDELRSGLASWLVSELDDLDVRWPGELPAGIIHGDMFPDNVFFEDGRVSGVIDFYFACNDMYAFDVAICLNAWCFEGPNTFSKKRSRALLEGYESVRPLSEEERNALPVLARGAAIRFITTRLHDWFHTPDDALATQKNPLDLVPIVEFHRAVSDSAAYGLD